MEFQLNMSILFYVFFILLIIKSDKSFNLFIAIVIILNKINIYSYISTSNL